MRTRLDAIREGMDHWGEDYGPTKEEILELLDVADAAAAWGEIAFGPWKGPETEDALDEASFILEEAIDPLLENLDVH